MQGATPGGAADGGKPPMLNYMGAGAAGLATQSTSIGASSGGLRKLSLNAGGNPMGAMGGPGLGLGLPSGGSTTSMGSFRSNNPSLQQSNMHQPLGGLGSNMAGAPRLPDHTASQEELQQRPPDQQYASAETPQRPYAGAGGFGSNQLDVQSQFGDGPGPSAFPQAHQYQSTQGPSGLNLQNLQSFNQRVAMTADRPNPAGHQALHARPAAGAMSTAGFSYHNPLLNQSERGGVQGLGGLPGNPASGAVSQHSGYGAIGPGASLSQYGGNMPPPGGILGQTNPLLNPSTSRSEANFNNFQVQNPLLTQNLKPQAQKASGNKFEFNRTLYESSIYVKVRAQDREDYTSPLTIKMIIHAPNSQNSQTQMLTVEVTDDEDPYFIYTMDCSEQDYHILKNEQQIMVDFQQFPNQFVELLNFCQQSALEAQQPGSQSAMLAQNAFVCVLDIGMSGEAVLKIVQTNQFKASDHLRLKFRKGNDEAIKRYLASKLKDATQSNKDLTERSTGLEQAYARSQETNEQLMHDIQQLREENRRVVDQMKIEEQKKINEVKEKMLVEQSEMQARNEAEMKDNTLRADQSSREMQEKILQQTDQIGALKTEILELTSKLKDEKRDLETENKEKENKIAQQQHELELIKNEIKELRLANKGLDSTKFTQEKSITEYTLKYQSLQRELEDKNSTVNDLKAHLKSTKEALDKAGEDHKALKAQNDKFQKKIEYCKDQMEKGNEHIQQLEDKKTTYKKQMMALKQQTQTNIGNKDIILKKQEDEIQQKVTELTEKQSQIRELNIDKQKLENDLDATRQQNQALKQKLEESLKSLESNANMIQWLNKQLNEKQTSATSGLYSGSAGFSSLAQAKPPMQTSSASKFQISSTLAARSPTRPGAIPSAATSTAMPGGSARASAFASPARSQAGQSEASQPSLNLAGKSFVSSLANLSVRAENPLKTVNDKPAMDAVSNATETKSISGQPITVAAPIMSSLPGSNSDDKLAPGGSQPTAGISFQPVSKYTRQLMEQQQKDLNQYKFDLPTRLGGPSSLAGSGITIGMSLKESISQKSAAESHLAQTPGSKTDIEVPTALDGASMTSHQSSTISNLKQQVDPGMSEIGAEYEEASSHANLDNVSMSQVSISQSQSEMPREQNQFAKQFGAPSGLHHAGLPMASSFGAGATIGANQLPGNSMSFAGGLKFSHGVQRPAEMPTSGPASMANVDISDNLTVVSKSDANPHGLFRMDMGNADSLSGVGEGARPVGASSTSFAMGAAMGMGAANPNITMSNNDTKTSDNEAFLAYMSKAEAGDDDDEDC